MGFRRVNSFASCLCKPRYATLPSTSTAPAGHFVTRSEHQVPLRNPVHPARVEDCLFFVTPTRSGGRCRLRHYSCPIATIPCQRSSCLLPELSFYPSRTCHRSGKSPPNTNSEFLPILLAAAGNSQGGAGDGSRAPMSIRHPFSISFHEYEGSHTNAKFCIQGLQFLQGSKVQSSPRSFSK